MNDSTETDAQRAAADVPLPGGEFRMFVQKLGYQALISLGAIENPLTGAAEAKPELARMVIDDLRMLRDKTQGNLDADEEEHLTGIIQSLELHATELAGVEVPESSGSNE